MAIVIVTHNMKSAFRIAHKIVLLNKGRIVIEGTPDEIKNSDNAYVRQFLEGVPYEVDYDVDFHLEDLIPQ